MGGGPCAFQDIPRSTLSPFLICMGPQSGRTTRWRLIRPNFLPRKETAHLCYSVVGCLKRWGSSSQIINLFLQHYDNAMSDLVCVDFLERAILFPSRFFSFCLPTRTFCPPSICTTTACAYQRKLQSRGCHSLFLNK